MSKPNPNLGGFQLPPKPEPRTELDRREPAAVERFVDPSYPGRDRLGGVTGPTGPIDPVPPPRAVAFTKERQERVTTYLPASVNRRLRIRCVELDVSMSAAVSDAIEMWLGGGNRVP